VSRSVRYAIGIALVLALIGAGSGYAVARWNQSQGQKEAPADWRAMVRGGACVASELREVVGDVANLLSPDRAPDPPAQADRDAASDAAGPSGQSSQSGQSGETADAGGSGGSPLDNLLAQGRDFVASLADGVPRLDESAADPGPVARVGRDGC